MGDCDLECVAGPIWWSRSGRAFHVRGSFLNSPDAAVLRTFARVATGTDQDSITGTAHVESFGDNGVRVLISTSSGRCYVAAEFVLVDVERGIWSAQASPVLVNALVALRRQHEVTYAD